MKKTLLMMVVILVLVGCSKSQNYETGRTYIIIKYDGCKITDVWKLKKTVIFNDPTFTTIQDEEGNVVQMKNGIKKIMLMQENSPLWDRYIEYHAELEPGVSYEEKLRSKKY